MQTNIAVAVILLNVITLPRQDGQYYYNISTILGNLLQERYIAVISLQCYVYNFAKIKMDNIVRIFLYNIGK